ncbi:DNA (cytosine-5-)-methyltransferase [Vibrio splendidus]|nr:DNA (cytosine-5-)-methyltransferase [Vibrio splendidus]MCC4880420.1 DNA (cytosine-5-)-methyltransferase [Vibrio splendidus]
MIKYFSPEMVSDLLGVSLYTVKSWISKGKLTNSNGKGFSREELATIPELSFLMDSKLTPHSKANTTLTSIELFCGAGGMAIGLKQAGFKHVMVNEIDPAASQTLKDNTPWNVLAKSIEEVDFTQYKGKISLISGGVPCQPFSHNGKRLGFNDIRGTLFFEFARAISEVEPDAFIMENVKGLMSHDKGRTLETIVDVLSDLGYEVQTPFLLNAFHYGIPQKRERLFIVGFKRDIKANFTIPRKDPDIMVVSDALKSGKLFDTDAPIAEGQQYTKKVLDYYRLIPEGGNWRDLPEELKPAAMGAGLTSNGGCSGTYKRLAWDRPSPTLTCSPAQKQTGRCHPIEDRPLTVREYARLQGFPDHWVFSGSRTAQYKQIGNAVPPKLAQRVGESVMQSLSKA